MGKMYLQSIPCNADAVACKNIMERSIAQSGLAKKVVAIELGVGDNTLSHWLSKKYGVTIPAHLVRRFCQVTMSWELWRWMGKRRVA